MTKYIALHTLKKSPEEVSEALSAVAPEAARATAAGETPAKCIYTWNPIPHGRTDYLFCLWEADKPEDVETTLSDFGMLEFVTLDTIAVDEVDWAQMAEALG